MYAGRHTRKPKNPVPLSLEATKPLVSRNCRILLLPKANIKIVEIFKPPGSSDMESALSDMLYSIPQMPLNCTSDFVTVPLP